MKSSIFGTFLDCSKYWTYCHNNKWMNMNCMKTCGICGGSYFWRKQHSHILIQWDFSECRDAGFAVYSMRIHPDLKVLNTVHEANWEACKENCNNVNKQCRNFIYNVRSINFIMYYICFVWMINELLWRVILILCRLGTVPVIF